MTHTVRSSSLIASVHRGVGGGKRECGSRDASEGSSGGSPGLHIVLLVPKLSLASFLGFIIVPRNWY